MYPPDTMATATVCIDRVSDLSPIAIDILMVMAIADHQKYPSSTAMRDETETLQCVEISLFS